MDLTVLERLQRLFIDAGVRYQQVEHESTKTCEDAARVRGTKADQGAKALVCWADGKSVVVTLPCSRKLDFKAVKKLKGVKDFHLASPAEVKELTGLEIGSIPPAGKVFGMETWMDEMLAREEQLCFNAGRHDTSMIMATEDYMRVIEPEVMAVSMMKS